MFHSTVKALVFILATTVAFSACSSRKSRIDEKLSLFTTYPPEVQMHIQNGDIDKGFTEEMVYMAKGTPEAKSSIRKKGKTLDIWKYPQPYKSGGGEPASSGLAGGYNYPTFGPGSPGTPMTQGTSTPQMRRTYLIVEFEKGKVVDWSEAK